MAIQQEVWIQDIQEVLFSDANAFLTKSVSHDEFVKNKTVHVPQAGSMPAAQKNRTVVPAQITERVDTDDNYDLDEYTTDPILLRDIDEIQSSYAKRQSIIRQHINIIDDRMAVEGAFQWGSDIAANQVRTTGTLVTDNLPNTTATGSRRRLTVVDIKNLAKILDKQNVPMANRFLLMPSDMYYEIFTINDLIKSDIAGTLTLPEAVANKILGFNVINRSSTLLYDDAGTPLRKAVGSADATSDNHGAIAWQQDFVSNAKGTTKIFEKSNDPLVYGDVFSAMVLQRAKKLRTNDIGVATLVQASS